MNKDGSMHAVHQPFLHDVGWLFYRGVSLYCLSFIFCLISGCGWLQDMVKPSEILEEKAISTDESPAAPTRTPENTDPLTSGDRLNTAMEEKQWTLAIQQAAQILSDDPKNIAVRESLAWAYLQTNQWQKAIPEFKQVLLFQPENVNAHANLAWAYAELGQWDQSIAHAQKAIDYDPEHAYAYANLGWAYSETRQPDKAIAAYEKAIQLKPDLVTAHYSLGVTYCTKGYREKAQNTRKTLIRYDKTLARQLAQYMDTNCAAIP